ncbi:MAG: HAD-IIIC family phosphatase [bacterium]
MKLLDELKYFEILELNRKKGLEIKEPVFNISILSNITIHQIKEIMELSLREENVPAIVTIGKYDNIVQDSINIKDANVVVIFWEVCNFSEGFYYKCDLLNENQLEEITNKIKSEIDFVIKNLSHVSLILFNKFSSLLFSHNKINKSNFEVITNKLNLFIEEINKTNFKIIEIDKIISVLSIDKSVDWRYFYSSMALYSINFFKQYCKFVEPIFLASTGKAKKMLVLDCDNTLWKGIVGEVGLDGIQMSEHNKDGKIFAEIQTLAIYLNNNGILLGLCSKNNSTDVEDVLTSHPDMKLKNENIVIKKINWTDKAKNLSDIANELNIGIDSIVFLDDSPFEINLIKNKLPNVTVLQVPNNLFEYPSFFKNNINMFYNLSLTAEDIAKVELYKQQIIREKSKDEYANIDDYLSSLQLKMTILKNDYSIIPRMSQLSQKTNQFNLTNNRYTEIDIKNFLQNELFDVFAISIEDKYGKSGIVGLIIINKDMRNFSAEIDTFLLSCRVIGRNIEFVFMDFLIGRAKKNNIKTLKSKYNVSKKNNQVSGFFDKCSFVLEEETLNFKKYSLEIKNYKPSNIKYIEVIYG